ncbi:MAG: glycyl-radical enzyme activating protein [Magnetococcus sp. WYHC-3]
MGRIFEIQRFCVHDGPGIRTTVFLQGCPLRCWWCHNPEGLEPKTLLSFLAEKCIGCGACLSACPHHAHRMENGQHVLNRDVCKCCGLCANQCHAGALENVGREVSVAEVLAEVMKDLPFYQKSGGGLTLSGGEPMVQLAFTEALLQQARQAGLHCVVETCGYAKPDDFRRILPLVDLFLFDIKDSNDAKHIMYTWVSMRPIRANLRLLHDAGAAIQVRLPIIPGLNDRPDHFARIAELARELPKLQGFEIIPYHRLGTDKRRRFGIENANSSNVAAPEPQEVAAWIQALRAQGVKVLNDPGSLSEISNKET